MSAPISILVATDREVLVIDPERGTSSPAEGITDRPTCLAVDAFVRGRAWCGTHQDGVFRSDDGGRSWHPVGLAGRLIMAVSAALMYLTRLNPLWILAGGGVAGAFLF